MALSKLYDDDAPRGFQFKLMTYNVDQAVREEKFEHTKWATRMPRVKALIQEVNADIVCIQELRQLPGCPAPEQFLTDVCGTRYRYVVEYRNPSPLAFGQAILYRADAFYPIRTRKFWLSDTPGVLSDTWAAKPGGTTGFGYICMGVEFQSVVNERVARQRPPFWVWNTHFGLEEELKTMSSRCVVEQLNGDTDMLVCGDFNFFPDKDATKQRAIFTNAGYADYGRGARTLIAGREVEGTFVGYEHDEFKSDLANMQSRLDHVWAYSAAQRFSRIGTPVLYAKTMRPEGEPAELTTRDYPSDHLPLVVDIQVN